MADANFYRAFEDRHRGSRELIKSRLRVYLPFIMPLKQFYGTCQGVDLGCGRGEWLELLQESGFDPQGVDLDDGMLAACQDLGLKVHTHDAVSFLKKLPSASQVIVSGFHIAEHIPFSDLQVLVQEALRVLKPGGLLILETPNPENIVVGTSNFYLDPTHQRPIPPQLLSFLPEYYGFKKVKTLRLQESVELSNGKATTLLNVLNGVSPDYAVVAQKAAKAELLAATSRAFEAEYGLTLENLAIRYDQQTETRISQADDNAQQAEDKAHWLQNEWDAAQQKMAELSHRTGALETELATQREQTAQREHELTTAREQVNTLEAKTHWLQNEWDAAKALANKLQTELDAVHAANHHHWQLAEAREQQIQALYQSHSWRITAPMRWLVSAPLRAANRVFHLPREAKLKSKEKIKLLLAHAKLYINRRPKLRRATIAVLSLFPTLKKRLRRATMDASTAQITQPPIATDLTNLTPRARVIYSDLKAAIQKNNQGNG